MANHHWPGDIRELQNVIERGVILTSGTVLSSQTTNSLIWRQAKAARVGEAESMSRKTLAEAERAHITAILRESRWWWADRMEQPPGWACQGQPLSPKCNVWAFPARRHEVGGREDSRTPRPPIWLRSLRACTGSISSRRKLSERWAVVKSKPRCNPGFRFRASARAHDRIPTWTRGRARNRSHC